MLTADRITLAPAAARRAAAAPETVLVGHAPGQADWRRLLAMPGAVRRIEALGFGRQIARLREIAALGGPVNATDRELTRLERLPIPLDGPGAFDALFPEAASTVVAYRTELGGGRAWLPGAVRDFFAAAKGADPGVPPDGANGGRVAGGGATAPGLTLWVVVVPEAAGADATLPNPSADHFAADRWSALGAFEIALLPPAAGLIGFPDLERLSMPPDLGLPPPPDAERPDPAFLPCDSTVSPAANLPSAPSTGAVPARAEMVRALPEIADGLARLRPDMHAVLAIPFAPEAAPGGLPGPDPQAIAALLAMAGGGPDAIGAAGGGAHRVQATYPFLTTAGGTLRSAAGAIMARMAATTARSGAWRSVAGRPLLSGARAWPPMDLAAVARLREEGRLGVLMTADGAAVLEDERVAAPALSRRRGPGSGEVSRFLGWLRREFTDFGNRLVFDADPRDPRPGIMLDGFLRRLHGAGALGGRNPDNAFRLTQRSGGPGQLVFEVQLALAPPIDRIRVTLAADRIDFAPGGGDGG